MDTMILNDRCTVMLKLDDKNRNRILVKSYEQNTDIISINKHNNILAVCLISPVHNACACRYFSFIKIYGSSDFVARRSKFKTLIQIT